MTEENATPEKSEQSFEELQRRVAQRQDGQKLLKYSDVPTTWQAKLVRLSMLGVLAFATVVGAGTAGSWLYAKRNPIESEFYDSSKEYLENQRAESEAFNSKKRDPLLYLPGGELVSTAYKPSSELITIEEVYRAPRPPYFLADIFHRRWKSHNVHVWGGPRGAGSVGLNGARELGGIFLDADFDPDYEHPGWTIVKLKLQREPKSHEKQAMNPPHWMPPPPPNAHLTVVGGGAPGAQQGRVYQYTIPGDITTAVNYYNKAFTLRGWESMGSHRSKDAKVRSHIFRNGAQGVTVQASSILLKSSPHTIISIVPF